ncbi:hypothetical protein CENSYa_0797 [Cenarchaeum symbiosum A]|uniref:Uncharacterized protein n=1 Tax=Cenarchaeum symbiosum (strain A) TaxID=414004 RepID=A0RVR3_CENSY|nr:hypothetical protein CENSYa_0797 [Cenarchaeum symbiosum A]
MPASIPVSLAGPVLISRHEPASWPHRLRTPEPLKVAEKPGCIIFAMGYAALLSLVEHNAFNGMAIMKPREFF